VAEIIVEASFKGVSGLPKDVFVNVFNFNTGGPITPTDLGVCFEKTAAFYITPYTTGTALAVLLSPNITPRKLYLKGYDRGDAIPRAPIGTAEVTIQAASAGGPLPEQIALCSSYFTDRNIKSHRGRIYVGPLGIAALNPSNGRPYANTVLKLVDASKDLAVLGEPASQAVVDAAFTAHTGITLGLHAALVAWALYSPTLHTSVAIHSGWVDDEWDGQSRRRVEATGRTVWP
jgi:hypothetical protein